MFDAIDFTHRDPEGVAARPRAAKGDVIRTYMAHHQGMLLVALANTLVDNCMPARFHADPRMRATELLLQERRPRFAPTVEPRPVENVPVVAPAPSMPVRRYRTADTLTPHAQFLSNGSFVSVVTNAGGGSSFWKGLAVTRQRRDFTRDWGSSFVYVRDVRNRVMWSTRGKLLILTYHRVCAEPDALITGNAHAAGFAFTFSSGSTGISHPAFPGRASASAPSSRRAAAWWAPARTSCEALAIAASIEPIAGVR